MVHAAFGVLRFTTVNTYDTRKNNVNYIYLFARQKVEKEKEIKKCSRSLGNEAE